jgi:hypothetical protein
VPLSREASAEEKAHPTVDGGDADVDADTNTDDELQASIAHGKRGGDPGLRLPPNRDGSDCAQSGSAGSAGSHLGSGSISHDRFRSAAMAIKEEFGLSLFGFDVIVPSSSSSNKHGNETASSGARIRSDSSNACGCGSTDAAADRDCGCGSRSSRLEQDTDPDPDFYDLVVIDVNYFPSYKEVPDFPQRLRRFLRKKAGMS